MEKILLCLFAPWAIYNHFNQRQSYLRVAFLVVFSTAVISFLSGITWGLRLASYLPESFRTIYGFIVIISAIGIFLGIIGAWAILSLVVNIITPLFTNNNLTYADMLTALGISYSPQLWISTTQFMLAYFSPLNRAASVNSLDDIVFLINENGYITISGYLNWVGVILTIANLIYLLSKLLKCSLWEITLPVITPFMLLIVIKEWLMQEVLGLV